MINKFKLLFSFENNTSNSLYPRFKLFILRWCFFSYIRVGFYEQLASLLKADIAMYDALVLMKDKYQSHQSIFKSFFLERKILDDMIYRVSSGYGSLSLAELLDGLVPNSDLIILAVDSRKTINALEKVIQIIAKFNKLKITVAKMFFTPIVNCPC